MALKFSCTNCGQPIISSFLKVGEKAKCRSCGIDVVIPVNAAETDEKTSYDTAPPPQPAPKSPSQNVYDQINYSPDEIDEKADFGTLTTFGKVLEAVGYIVVALAAIVCFYMISKDNTLLAIVYGVIGAINGFIIIAFGELISLFVSLEKNTKKTWMLLEKQMK